MTDLTSTIARLRELSARVARGGNVYHPTELVDAFRNALPALLDAAERADRLEKERDMLPKDSVVVPVEPTEAMLRAGHQEIDWCRTEQPNTYDMNSPPIDGVGTTCRQDLFDAYRAMLAARPGTSHE